MTKIALVDDNRNYLVSLSMALEAEGLEVDCYSDGQAALRAFDARRPDLVVLDLKMPRMDGMELLDRLRRKSSLPVIILSSRDSELDEALGLRMGADDYLRKSGSQRVLIARIRALLRRQTAWAAAKRIVLESVDDPSSTLRTRVSDSVVRIGESLCDDPEMRDKVDNWIVRAAQHLVAQYGTEITAIITETIERWDADEASRRIELHVGRDLQFIRINGTVVGSLAGLVIYTVAQLLF